MKKFPVIQRAFTMAEVLITLGIIGIVASMTLPGVIEGYREKENVTRLEKFLSVLSQAVNLYKAQNDCPLSISDCLGGGIDSDCANFEQIASRMKIVDSATRSTKNEKFWLPEQSYNYYGEVVSGNYGGVSKSVAGDCVYLLPEGTTFSVDVNPTSFDIAVDVNGAKLPNRVGRDIFFVLIGANANFTYENSQRYNSGYTEDIFLYPLFTGGGESNAYNDICSIQYECNPVNIDPTKNNGASITAYTILTKKIPPLYNRN